jgi:hypothetical protein
MLRPLRSVILLKGWRGVQYRFLASTGEQFLVAGVGLSHLVITRPGETILLSL